MQMGWFQNLFQIGDPQKLNMLNVGVKHVKHIRPYDQKVVEIWQANAAVHIEKESTLGM